MKQIEKGKWIDAGMDGKPYADTSDAEFSSSRNCYNTKTKAYKLIDYRESCSSLYVSPDPSAHTETGKSGRISKPVISVLDSTIKTRYAMLRSMVRKDKPDHDPHDPHDPRDPCAEPAPVTLVALPPINPIVPRRAPGVMGRRPFAFGDLNYQVIAPVVGVSPTHLGRILNGINRPSMTVASKLAAMFGWTLDQINQLYERRTNHKTATATKESNFNAKSRNRNRTIRTASGTTSGTVKTARANQTADRPGKLNHPRPGSRVIATRAAAAKRTKKD